MTVRADGQPRTVEQAAAVLNLSRATIRAWITQRRLGHVRLGRAIRIPAQEIRRVLEAGFVPAVPEQRR
jgi:excisionase family DNA binding protein